MCTVLCFQVVTIGHYYLVPNILTCFGEILYGLRDGIGNACGLHSERDSTYKSVVRCKVTTNKLNCNGRWCRWQKRFRLNCKKRSISAVTIVSKHLPPRRDKIDMRSSICFGSCYIQVVDGYNRQKKAGYSFENLPLTGFKLQNDFVSLLSKLLGCLLLRRESERLKVVQHNFETELEHWNYGHYWKRVMAFRKNKVVCRSPNCKQRLSPESIANDGDKCVLKSTKSFLGSAGSLCARFIEIRSVTFWDEGPKERPSARFHFASSDWRNRWRNVWLIVE